MSCFTVPVTAPYKGAIPLKVFYVRKVYAMLVQVSLAFSLIPFVVCHIVYALCPYVKRFGIRLRGLSWVCAKINLQSQYVQGVRSSGDQGSVL